MEDEAERGKHLRKMRQRLKAIGKMRQRVKAIWKIRGNSGTEDEMNE